MRKWTRPRRGLFLFLWTTVIIVMYAIFKINSIVSEWACLFYNVHPTYLFYNSQPSNNLHSSKQRSWESNFSFLNEWKFVLLKSKSLLLHIQKNIFHENANTFEIGPAAETESLVVFQVSDDSNFVLNNVSYTNTKTF